MMALLLVVLPLVLRLPESAANEDSKIKRNEGNQKEQVDVDSAAQALIPRVFFE
jgi:hypothetical protein